jgi:hypothetical protein
MKEESPDLNRPKSPSSRYEPPKLQKLGLLRELTKRKRSGPNIESQGNGKYKVTF